MASGDSSSNHSESGAKRQPGVFPVTQWSLVMAASEGSSPRAEAALRELCQRYREPVLRNLLALGYRQDAEDLANGFVEFLLEKNRLEKYVRGTAKFRSFLITCLDGFRRDEWRKCNAAKRGGGQEIVSLDELEVGTGSATELDRALDRDFAMTLHSRILAKMAAQRNKEQELQRFEALKPYLLVGDRSLSYAELSNRIGLNASALRVAMLRLRREYAETFRSEVADTTAPTEIETEMKYLVSLLVDTQALNQPPESL